MTKAYASLIKSNFEKWVLMADKEIFVSHIWLAGNWNVTLQIGRLILAPFEFENNNILPRILDAVIAGTRADFGRIRSSMENDKCLWKN